MNSFTHHKIDAFTIFEVTVVLAIMSVIISIVAVSFNRFQEQLKVSQDISSELNQFRMVRSTLWKDFTNADSIQFAKKELSIYSNDVKIGYQVIDDHLHRNHTGEWQDLNVESESISVEELEGSMTYHIDFLWKGNHIDWNYSDQPDLAAKINQHFNQLK